MPADASRAALARRVPLSAGALLHKTRPDLRKWLLAIWLRRRKITQAMRRGAHELLRRGVVELDESLLGGREPGSGRRGRTAQRKTLGAATAEQVPQGGRGHAHLRLIDDAGAKTLTKAAGAQIQPGGAVKSDGLCAYRALPGAGYLHGPHVQATPQAAGELLPWAHIVTPHLHALATRRLPWRQRRAPAVLSRRVLLPALVAVTHGSASCAAS